MAHIKKIHFDSVSTNEGCTCDKCGQYIKNIWSVEFTTGDTFHYGIDCWRKIQATGGLNKQNKRELYCTANGIHSFADVSLEDYLTFNLWMKDEKKVAQQTGFISCHVVEEIIRIGQIKGWNVPQFHLPKTETACQLWPVQKTMKTHKTKPIPEDIFDKILYHAVHDEKDILTKAGIIIQSQTGLRINEVLSIKEGCVKRTSDGYDYMEVTLGKTEKGEPIIHKVFINDLVKNVIAELSEATAELRKESGLKELFLFKHGKIRVIPTTKWTENRLPTFIRKWNIQDSKYLKPLVESLEVQLDGKESVG